MSECIPPLPGLWKSLLEKETAKAPFRELCEKLNSLYETRPVFPPVRQIFSAFELCNFEALKIVIIGQDPYHGPGQAHGLSFSVPETVKIPPSLRNIFKELESDIEGFKSPKSGNLSDWARQGVLLLNAILSVEGGNAGSHKNLGWESFTDEVIKVISSEKNAVVFLLWGTFAISKKHLIDEKKHLVLTAAHPSPLARGAFFGCKHFSKANDWLRAKSIQPINWHLS